MKSASANLIAHLQSANRTLAFLWRLTRKDETVFRFTDHDEAISLTGSPVETFTPIGSIARTAFKHGDKMRAEGVSGQLIFDDAGITETDMRAGLWDNALIEVYIVNWQAPEDGTIQLGRLRTGEVSWGEGQGEAQAKSLGLFLETTVGEVYSADCTAILGDSACGVRLDPPTWQASTAYTVRQDRDAKTGSVVKPTSANRRHFKCVTAGTSDGSEPAWDTVIGNQTSDGTVVWEAIQALTVTGAVTSVTDALREFEDTSLVEADDFWSLGLVTWLTGANAGLKMEIDNYLTGGSPSLGQVVLKLDMPFDIEVGDTYSLSAGCDKTLATCKAKFDNVLNFRGHGVHLPGMENLLRTPDAK